MKRSIIIATGVIVVAIIIFFIVRSNRKEQSADIFATVKRGPFKVEIETTGELEAKNSVKIQGPTALRDFRIFNVAIQKIVDEGTVVKRGDWIATLDKSDFLNRFQEKQIELEREQAQFIQTQLDTTLQLRQSRDQLINLQYAVEERKIVLEQSKFEPPATIKQAEINLDKARREYEQAVENYKIKKRQNIERMKEASARLRKVQNEFNSLNQLSQSFTIIAPEDGMVIYTKGWDNRPIKAGSQINTWDPTVATLPDLTKMMSKTYVNEVDVRKVKRGQQVEIGLDAYPDKKLTGQITRVANVGEQRQNSDAKVFQVDVEIKGSDPSLRPGMTTSNKIVAKVIDSVLFVPLECLHSQFDSITYVFKKEGINTVKQEVMVGEANANDVIILAGLSEGERVHLSVPSGMTGTSINLIPQMDGKRRKPEAEEAPVKENMINIPDGAMMIPSGANQMQTPRPAETTNGSQNQDRQGVRRQNGQTQRDQPSGGGSGEQRIRREGTPTGGGQDGQQRRRSRRDSTSTTVQ